LIHLKNTEALLVGSKENGLEVSAEKILSTWLCIKTIMQEDVTNWFECAVSGVRYPQHTKTGSNSSTIAADSSNGVTNTWCCRYSCLPSWWWVEV